MKENAMKDFLSMIEKSWTYNRMTDSEKAVLRRCFEDWQGNFTGTYKQRWHALSMVYSFYLAGLGYTGGGSWREQAVSAPPTVPETIPISQEVRKARKEKQRNEENQ